MNLKRTLIRLVLVGISLVLWHLPALAKVELYTSAKPAVSEDSVIISHHDKGQFNRCEEIGLVHNRNDLGGFQTKTGMFKRMKKQVAKVGGTHVLITDTTTRDVQQSTGIVFYCPGSVGKMPVQ